MSEKSRKTLEVAFFGVDDDGEETEIFRHSVKSSWKDKDQDLLETIHKIDFKEELAEVLLTRTIQDLREKRDAIVQEIKENL